MIINPRVCLAITSHQGLGYLDDGPIYDIPYCVDARRRRIRPEGAFLIHPDGTVDGKPKTSFTLYEPIMGVKKHVDFHQDVCTVNHGAINLQAPPHGNTNYIHNTNKTYVLKRITRGVSQMGDFEES